MPLTKIIPRKYSQCVICKELVHREEYARNIANRHECGSSFKKALFLSKHKKRLHDNKEASVVRTQQ